MMIGFKRIAGPRFHIQRVKHNRRCFAFAFCSFIEYRRSSLMRS